MATHIYGFVAFHTTTISFYSSLNFPMLLILNMSCYEAKNKGYRLNFMKIITNTSFLTRDHYSTPSVLVLFNALERTHH